jgi:hypothetical protein
MATSVRSAFLELPRELRNLIYKEYFTNDGGYTFDYDTGTLRRTSGTAIDLQLRQTCWLVANETRGLAFELNTVHFSTVYQKDHRETFGHFSVLLAILIFHKTETLKDATLAGHFDESVCSQILDAHPQFSGFVPLMQERNTSTNTRYHDWKVAHSIGRQFIIDALGALAAQSHCKKRYHQPNIGYSQKLNMAMSYRCGSSLGLYQQRFVSRNSKEPCLYGQKWKWDMFSMLLRSATLRLISISRSTASPLHPPPSVT